MNLEQLTSQLQDAIAAQEIYNADYQAAKQWANRLLDDALKAVKYSDDNLDVMFDIGLVYIHQVPGLLKKLDHKKYQQHPELVAEIKGVAKSFEIIHSQLDQLKPLIKTGRKPSDRKTKPRTLENTGTCAVCGQNCKLKSGLIVHHGYIVRGERIGRCFGVDYAAWEISPDGAKAYVEALKTSCDQLRNYLQKLRSGEVKQLTYNKKRINPGDQFWQVALNLATNNTTAEIQSHARLIDSIERKITEWKPKTIIKPES